LGGENVGASITPMQLPVGEDPEKFRHVVNAAYTAYIGSGGRAIPDAKDVMEYVQGSTIKTVARIMETPEFVLAVKNRGVPWENINGLTTRQMLAITVMTNPHDRRNPAAKLKAVGVSHSQYAAWCKQPVFKRHMERVTEGLINDNIGLMQTALVNKATNGDLNAIKFVYEMTGKHDPASKEVIQLRSIVSMLLEILSRHLSSQPEVLQAVAIDIQQAMPKAVTSGEVLR
jgi:hypothetical protein